MRNELNLWVAGGDMRQHFSAVKKGLFPMFRHLIAMKRDFIALTRNFVALKSDFI